MNNTDDFSTQIEAKYSPRIILFVDEKLNWHRLTFQVVVNPFDGTVFSDR